MEEVHDAAVVGVTEVGLGMVVEIDLVEVNVGVVEEPDFTNDADIADFIVVGVTEEEGTGTDNVD